MKKCFLILLFFTISCQNKEDWPYSNVFFGMAVDGFPVTEQVLATQRESRISPEMIVFYLQWQDKAPSIASSLDVIWNMGAIPCMTWEPMMLTAQGETMILYQDILAGIHDLYLSAMANHVKRWKKPLIIRFAQEMNISRYHWGTKKEDFGPDSPEIYIKMFQYVVKLFKNLNVENVLWAFCPNVDSIPNESWNAAANYYPGDEFVHILGMDGYNWNSKSIPSRSFEKIFQPLFNELKSINSHKPIIVFETASVNRPGDPEKSIWVHDALKTARRWGLKGIVWFQVNKEEDWRINQNEDFSYIPLIKTQEPSFQTWLVNQSILSK